MKEDMGMKKWLGLVLALVMMVSMVSCAMAESESETLKKTVGEGASSIYVLVETSDDSHQGVMYTVNTDETILLNALQKVSLISGENASWGFYVTTVDGITADYDTTDQYWNIYAYNSAEDKLEKLETGIDVTPITDGDIYLFYLQ